MNTTGIHLLTEFSGCPAQKLADAAWLSQLLASIAKSANATILGSSLNQRSPSGLLAVLNLSDAQISIRTWPDAGYATIDMYSCGSVALPRVLLGQFIKDFDAKSHQTIELERGVADASGVFTNRVVSAPSAPTTVAAPAVSSTPAPDPTAAKTAIRKRHIPQPIE